MTPPARGRTSGSPSIEVILLHEDGVAAFVDGREVVDERSVFLCRAAEMVVILHGWRTKRDRTGK